MQQTETYKLNLIETSDPFSPQALNENTQKLEEVVHEKLEDMDTRVTVLEARRIAWGTFNFPTSGAPYTNHVVLGFTPKVVCVKNVQTGGITAALSVDTPGGQDDRVKLEENGFMIWTLQGQPYNYVALA